MSKITKTALAVTPVTLPPLLVLIMLYFFDKFDQFGDRSDVPLFSFALAIQALYATFRASKLPAMGRPTWLGWSWAFAIVTLLLSVVVVVLFMLLEFKMLETGVSRMLPRVASLNLLALGLSCLAAFVGEYASA